MFRRAQKIFRQDQKQNAAGFLSLLAGLCLCIMPVCAEESPQAKAFPLHDPIHAIMDHVSYSGLKDILRPDVDLKIDFQKKSWTLTNIHRYDDYGNILLEDNKYGLCGELATFMYQKLYPLMDDRFTLTFAQSTESGFFPTPESNHIILLVHDVATKDIFLIDPSFHQFDLLKNLPQYEVLNLRDSLGFMQDRSTDVTFLADQAMPLLIMDDLLLSFSVSSVDGKFDQDNFMFIVTANRRTKTNFLNMLVVGRYQGQEQGFENKPILNVFLKPEERQQLYNKLHEWLFSNQSS